MLFYFLETEAQDAKWLMERPGEREAFELGHLMLNLFSHLTDDDDISVPRTALLDCICVYLLV